MSERSLISAATASQIKRIARRATPTILAVADPPRELEIWRYDDAGAYERVAAGLFHVKQSNTLALAGGDEGITVTQIAGSIAREIEDEWARLEPGDRFSLAEFPRASCVIASVNLDRYGRESATWTLEQGSPG